MASRQLGIDGFLGHKTAGKGFGAKRLKDWKKRNPPQIDTWLHKRAKIISVFRHGIPIVQNREDRETKAKRVELWTDKAVCWEPEDVLLQRRRNSDGTREVPFTLCGVCKLIEWFRVAVANGELKWTDEIFKFTADDDERIIHAGGVYNAFSASDMGDTDKADLRKHKIKQTEAWKENWLAKAFYLFAVVDNDNPGDGVCVADEAGLLGDKVKRVINDARASLGEDDGNPLIKPYCIRWEKHDEEKEFGKKYHALRVEKIKLTPAIKKLIDGTEPPDMSHYTEFYNAQTMRSRLEEACLIDGVPWDEIFSLKEHPGFEGDDDNEEEESDEEESDEEESDEEESDEEESDEEESDEEEPVKPAPKKKVQSQVPTHARRKEPDPEPDEEMFACDDCKKPMKGSDAKCPHCGKVYVVEKEPEKPAPKMRSRSEIAAEKEKSATSAKVTVKPAAKANTKPAKKSEPMRPEDDDIPF